MTVARFLFATGREYLSNGARGRRASSKIPTEYKNVSVVRSATEIPQNPAAHSTYPNGVLVARNARSTFEFFRARSLAPCTDVRSLSSPFEALLQSLVPADLVEECVIHTWPL